MLTIILGNYTSKLFYFLPILLHSNFRRKCSNRNFEYFLEFDTKKLIFRNRLTIGNKKNIVSNVICF